MNDRSPSQTSGEPNKPKPGQTTSETDPCEDPKPPPPPKPCPDPPVVECKDPMPCPDPPPPPCPPPPPDPCAGSPEGGGGDPGASTPEPPDSPEPPTNQGETPTPPPYQGEKPEPTPVEPECGDTGTGGGGGGPSTSLNDQLVKLEAELLSAQTAIKQLELTKANASALGPQIQALKDLLKAQQSTTDGYRNFFHDAQMQVDGSAQHVDTVRCLLKIPNKQCVKDAIAAGHARVTAAASARNSRQAALNAAEQKHARAVFQLEHATRIYTFFKSGLQAHVKTQLGELSKLRALADPKKDHCETEFYLTEIEWHLKSEHCDKSTSQECYESDLRLATFLACWPPHHYSVGFDRAAVAFNGAVIAEKNAKAELEQAKIELKSADDALTQARDSRVAWTLAELKSRGCCKPKDAPAAAV